MKIKRLKIAVRGTVQSVGFRQFVFRLANELHLTGTVSNSVRGVDIEIEGRREVFTEFLIRLESEKPPHSIIQSVECALVNVVGSDHFEIVSSKDAGAKTALTLPNIATPADCLREA